MLVTLLGFTSFCLTLSALPSWAVRGGVSPGLAGSVTTVMLLTTVGTQLLLPAALRRWGTARVLAAGLLTLGAPAPLLALSHDLALLLPVSAVRGTGFAVLTVVGSLLTTVVAPEDRHGEAVGLYGLAIAVPNLVGIPAGVALTQAGSFWAVAVLGAAPVLGVPAALALGRGHRPEPVPTVLPGEPAPEGRRTVLRAMVAPTAVLGAATLAAGGLVTFLPIVLASRSATAVVALLLFGLTSAVSRWRVGVLVDRFGLALLLPGSVVASVAGMALVAAGLHTGSHGLVLAGAFVFGAGYGGVLNATLVVAFARAGAAGTTTASSLWNAAFDSGTAVGAVLLGALVSAGVAVPAAFLVTAVLMLATLLVVPRR